MTKQTTENVEVYTNTEWRAFRNFQMVDLVNYENI